MLTSYAAFFHDVFSYDPFPLDYFHEFGPMWDLPCFLHLNCEGFLDHPTRRTHPFLIAKQPRCWLQFTYCYVWLSIMLSVKLQCIVLTRKPWYPTCFCHRGTARYFHLKLSISHIRLICTISGIWWLRIWWLRLGSMCVGAGRSATSRQLSADRRVRRLTRRNWPFFRSYPCIYHSLFRSIG